MKKFYTLAAAVAFCGISALALDGPIMTSRSNNLSNTTTFHQLNPERKLSGALKHTPTLKGAVSRAEEEFDLREFTQSIYLDQFYNEVDDQGYFIDPLQSGCGVEWNYDEATGKVTISGFLEDFDVEIKVGEGTVSLPLGQLVFENTSYKFYTATVESETGKGITTGEAQFDIYSNGLVYQGGIGIWVTDKAGTGLGWQAAALNYFLLQPNATVTGKTANGEAFENRIYTEYQMEVVEMEDGAFDLLTLSNIMPWNSGFFVDFICSLDYQGDNFGLSYYEEPRAYHPIWLDQTTQSGDFYLVFLEEQTYGYGMSITIADDKMSADFDYNWSAYDYNVSQQWFGEMEPLHIAFDKSLIEMGGVADVAVDEEVNGPAKYYTIQGVEVANPTAGQIYIVKEGNKVTKRIIR